MDAMFEQYGARQHRTDFRRYRRLGARDLRQDSGDHTVVSEAHAQCGLEDPLSGTPTRGTRSSTDQDHTGHGERTLQNAGDSAKENLGVSARLQSHPADDGPGGRARRKR